MNLNLTNNNLATGQFRRNITGTVPTVPEPPLIPDNRIAETPDNSFQASCRPTTCEAAYLIRRKHTVIDTEFVEITPAKEISLAADKMRCNTPRPYSKLVKP